MLKKNESLYSWWLRWKLNTFPAYWATGGQITYIAKELNEVHVHLPHNWLTRNQVGTLLGSTIYGAFEPIYTFMLSKLLGKDYVIWDRGGKVHYKRPAKGSLQARFLLTPFQLENIKEVVNKKQEFDFFFEVKITDKKERLVAELHQTLYIARKDFFKIKLFHKQIEDESLAYPF